MTNPSKDIAGSELDKTDIGIILSDYLGSQWNGNMCEDLLALFEHKLTAHDAEIKQQLLQQVSDEVIGEDDTVSSERTLRQLPENQRIELFARNQLRLEQRNSLLLIQQEALQNRGDKP